MSQISLSEASDILKKLFDERLPLTAYLITPSRARVRLNGFIVGATREKGLFVGDRLPPAIPSNFINLFPFTEGECIFTYGEKREIGEDIRASLPADLEDSMLMISFPVTHELLTLFFTV